MRMKPGVQKSGQVSQGPEPSAYSGAFSARIEPCPAPRPAPASGFQPVVKRFVFHPGQCGRGYKLALLLAGCLLAAAPAARSQDGAQKPQKQQNQPNSAQKPVPAPQPQKPAGGNPFPEDESTVPVMPSGNAANLPADMSSEAAGRAAAPANDSDPVRSPDAMPSDNGETQGFSSSQSGLGNLTAPPPATGRQKKGDDSALEGPPKETPKEDLNVGNYYLDIKDWRGALSRFQSALVLAPDEPDVYWGLAECERHLGQYAAARANYLKVMEYDPGSHHAKEAKKALEDPEIANAKGPQTP